jgi:hypothetical protein
MTSRWMFMDSLGKQKGPVPRDTIERLLRKNVVQWACNAWTDGMAEWKPLSGVRRLLMTL